MSGNLNMASGDDFRAKQSSNGLLKWLGYADSPNYKVARPLGHFLGFIIALLFLGAIVGALVTLVRIFGGGKESASLGAGALLVAILSSPFVIWRNYTAQKQVEYQKEGYITERITKAVEQLGAEKNITKFKSAPVQVEGDPLPSQSDQTLSITLPNIEVRVGAALSLERIAEDSVFYDSGRDHTRVMEILSAYVRHNVRLDAQQTHIMGDYHARIDVQTALDVIGRRKKQQQEIERRVKYRLNMQRAIYNEYSFDYGNFFAAFLHECTFIRCSFRGANLAAADFSGSSFEDCVFVGAVMDGTILDHCKLTYSSPEKDFAVGLPSAKLRSATLAGAKLGPRLLPQQIFSKVFVTADTCLGESDAFVSEMKKLKENFKISQELGQPEAAQLHADILRKGYEYWSEYEARDLMTPLRRNLFYENFGLKGWPYRA